MIYLKNPDEIAIMKLGGDKLCTVFDEIEKILKPSITTLDIENVAVKTIEKLGGYPGFKKVHNYKYATCVCINEQVVHTPPGSQVIHDGDIVTIDTGVLYKGLNTDKAITYIVGTVKNKNHTDFLRTGKQALQSGIKQAIAGNNVGHISQSIQNVIEGNGYNVVRELTGHGIGKELHEEPAVLQYLHTDIKKTPILKSGMTIAVEVIYTLGLPQIKYEKGSNWSLITRDNSVAACFEHTICVQKDAPLILA